ncbi:PepSY-like domain-containing protein [Taibaiella soli]|uniref:Putative beta-lactamase-inhibitor-like PepSY-like domain-containing protein n=1 Tax=Taibaiella soli TaxID=1649169 RepID=A0A2W2AGJ3_9BACT|nr:PepSY-like domain-containing protein [Taibaiella soli]PZF74381.1 hypothetical protein DN068_02030 [Taibaiella soli]
MRRYSLLAITFFSLTVTAVAQEKNIQITPAVRAAFQNDFPDAQEVEWKQENWDYKVDFVQKEKEISAIYDALGKRLQTEKEITATELPDVVLNYVKEHAGKPEGASKVTKADGTVLYEVETDEAELLLDASGNLLETEVEIPASALPADAATYIKDHYKTAAKDISKTTKSNGDIRYEVEVKNAELLFDANGQFIKATQD